MMSPWRSRLRGAGSSSELPRRSTARGGRHELAAAEQVWPHGLWWLRLHWGWPGCSPACRGRAGLLARRRQSAALGPRRIAAHRRRPAGCRGLGLASGSSRRWPSARCGRRSCCRTKCRRIECTGRSCRAGPRMGPHSPRRFVAAGARATAVAALVRASAVLVAAAQRAAGSGTAGRCGRGRRGARGICRSAARLGPVGGALHNPRGTDWPRSACGKTPTPYHGELP